jgi:hypothetical protein
MEYDRTESFALGNAYDAGYKAGFKSSCQEAAEDIKSILDMSLTDREKLTRVMFLSVEFGKV